MTFPVHLLLAANSPNHYHRCNNANKTNNDQAVVLGLGALSSEKPLKLTDGPSVELRSALPATLSYTKL